MGGGLGRVSKHPDYYLSDGSVSFLTGNTLFRVHRSFFERESEVFRDLFASAAEEDPQSGTDARPYTLDVKADEFAQLLWVWYDRDYSYQRQPKDAWVTILQLATRWAFPKIKELAIREIDALGISPAERVAIYNKHGIDDDRLLESYVELCRSPTVPTEQEGHLMQMETLINVLQAREDTQRKAYKLRRESPTSAGLEDETLREVVSRFFKTGSSLVPRLNGAESMGAGAQASSLNGEHAQGTSATSTITLGEPQVPNRTNQSGGPSSHTNTSLQTGNEGKENHDKEKGSQVENNETRGKTETKGKDGDDKNKVAKAAEERGKEEKDKLEQARLAKEKEDKEKVDKARQAREKIEKLGTQRLKKAEERPESPLGGRGRGKP